MYQRILFGRGAQWWGTKIHSWPRVKNTLSASRYIVFSTEHPQKGFQRFGASKIVFSSQTLFFSKKWTIFGHFGSKNVFYRKNSWQNGVLGVGDPSKSIFRHKTYFSWKIGTFWRKKCLVQKICFGKKLKKEYFTFYQKGLRIFYFQSPYFWPKIKNI